jgi:hypothetical protein
MRLYTTKRDVQAKLAVTNTLANPPKPPTKGAPGICQLLTPINRCSVFSPTFTKMPTMMKRMTVNTFKEESQYSTIKQACLITVLNAEGLRTELSICLHVCSVHSNEEQPKQETNNPRTPRCPILQNQLSSSKIRRD